MLHEFWDNFTANLFKPLLLFFYFGFLIPILKVRFEFPYVIYQGLTMYLLVAIGWQGGEELAKVKPEDIDNIAGFMLLGFVLNFVIGIGAYLLLKYMTKMRQVDRATVAGLLRLRLGRNLRHLCGLPGGRAHRLQRLHAGNAGLHGDSGLPGGAVPGRATAAPWFGRSGLHAGRARLHSAGQSRSRSRHRRPAAATARASTASTTRSSRSWNSRWKSSSIRTGSPTKPRARQGQEDAHLLPCAPAGSVPQSRAGVSSSAASSLASSVGCRDRRSFTTTTTCSFWRFKVCSACSCSRWG